jgi:hypothetical protein
MIDLRDLRVLREFTSPKYKNAVSWNRASFSPDGRLIVAGSQTGNFQYSHHLHHFFHD